MKRPAVQTQKQEEKQPPPPRQKMTRQELLVNAFRSLELPPDLAAGMAHLELSGDREAVVDGLSSVLEYDENVIRLRVGKLSVRFTGKELRLRNLKRDSVIIEGRIASVEFLP